MKKLALSLICLTSCLFLQSCEQKAKDLQTRIAEENLQGDEKIRPILRVTSLNDPSTLDPRTARDLTSISFLRMVFEGLMRTDFNGKPALGVAEDVQISEDLKTYTFKLRECYWSNGDLVKANDFIHAWKSQLKPEFPAPNAYHLYVIKGAKEAKSGAISTDSIGLRAPDTSTLVVELEEATPYFLELVATHTFFPINSRWDESHPKWMESQGKELVGNGPYQLERWAHHNELSFSKNPFYWDILNVEIGGISVLILDPNTAFQMFEEGSLDWAGSTMSDLPADSLASLKKQGYLYTAPAAGVKFIRFNTEKSLLKNEKIRQALSYAIDREEIVEHILQANEIPATGLIPPSLGLSEEPYFKDHDVTLAAQLFAEGLQEMKGNAGSESPLTLMYGSDERSHKIAQALQEQWLKTLQIRVELESVEPKILYDRLKYGQFMMSIGSWFADFMDPINFLEVFKSKNNGTNNTYWENEDYIGLINASMKEGNHEKRNLLLQKAEAILMKAMPIAPLFFSSSNYVKKDNVQGVYISELGYMDFKSALIDNGEVDPLAPSTR